MVLAERREGEDLRQRSLRFESPDRRKALLNASCLSVLVSRKKYDFLLTCLGRISSNISKGVENMSLGYTVLSGKFRGSGSMVAAKGTGAAAGGVHVGRACITIGTILISITVSCQVDAIGAITVTAVVGDG